MMVSVSGCVRVPAFKHLRGKNGNRVGILCVVKERVIKDGDREIKEVTEGCHTSLAALMIMRTRAQRAFDDVSDVGIMCDL
jgi:hypothetical protein